MFTSSLRRIARNPHVSTPRGVANHVVWQLRKVARWFPFEQRLSRSRIVATDRDCGVSALINSQGMYDYNNMHLVRWLADQGAAFIDVGANIGAYSLIASESPACTVVAVEPHPRTFAQLQHNIALNGRRNVIALNLALGAEQGSVAFTDASSSTNHVVTGPAAMGTITVPCDRAESCLAELHVTPHVVKLDVEGHEHAVLQGFGPRLAAIEVLLIEVNELADERGRGFAAIRELVTSAGLAGPYSCDFDARSLVPALAATTEDYVFVSSAGVARLATGGFKVASLGR